MPALTSSELHRVRSVRTAQRARSLPRAELVRVEQDGATWRATVKRADGRLVWLYRASWAAALDAARELVRQLDGGVRC